MAFTDCTRGMETETAITGCRLLNNLRDQLSFRKRFEIVLVEATYSPRRLLHFTYGLFRIYCNTICLRHQKMVWRGGFSACVKVSGKGDSEEEIVKDANQHWLFSD